MMTITPDKTQVLREPMPAKAEGRLAARRWQEGDPLPAVGSYCLISGVHGDIESDQHRSFQRRKVIGYSEGYNFICLQTDGCWPTVERTTNCWFARIDAALSSPKEAEPLASEVERPDHRLANRLSALREQAVNDGRKLVTINLDSVDRILAAIQSSPPAVASPSWLDRFDAHRLGIAQRRPSAKRDELLSELDTIRNSMCRASPPVASQAPASDTREAVIEECAAAVKAMIPEPAGGPYSHTNTMRVVLADAEKAIRALAHTDGSQ